MPVSSRSSAFTDSDNYSLLSQATTTITIGDSLPAHSARKGFTFNIMSVGQSGVGKTALMSAMFGKRFEMAKDKRSGSVTSSQGPGGDSLNPQVGIESKTIEFEENRVRVRLTVVESQNYGEALCLRNTHQPLVEFIDQQFENYHKRESGVDRRNIQDKMIHCLFFFVSALGHGLSKLDLEFLKAIHNRVNVVPIIARAEALTVTERLAFKRRLKDDLEREAIEVYQMPDPDPEDSDDMKRSIKEIQESMPFAVCHMTFVNDNMQVERDLEFGTINHYTREHSDFLLLKSMLHKQMPDLRDLTHEVFYENYRLRRIGSKG